MLCVRDFCSLRQYNEHMHHIFGLLTTNAFLKQFRTQILHITPILYIFVNRIYLVLFTNNLLIYSCDVLCKGRGLFPNCCFFLSFHWMVLKRETLLMACNKPKRVDSSNYLWCLIMFWDIYIHVYLRKLVKGNCYQKYQFTILGLQ